jgi:hypothetical protein
MILAKQNLKFHALVQKCHFGKIAKMALSNRCTEVRFANLLSGGFITAIVVNSPEKKLAKCTSVRCMKFEILFDQKYSFEALCNCQDLCRKKYKKGIV